VSSDQKRVILQVVLGIVIVVLAYVLYVSITAPYEQIRAEQRMTERVRARMRLVSDALISYRDQQGRFPNTLDSLRTFVAQNQQLRNNLSSEAEIQDFAPDSLLQSPRTGEPFQYETSSDSARVDIYRLRDPDSQDQIGTLDLDVTRVNAANWE
jgi:type II secretory pathway pseudopilin PulG